MASPEERAKGFRYDAIIATLVGFLALMVSGYTAYMQRQQVRAQVWPILEYAQANMPLRLSLANKGVGPALIRHAVVSVDDTPVHSWDEIEVRLLGPGKYTNRYSFVNGRVLAAGESVDIFKPLDSTTGAELTAADGKLGTRLDKERDRIGIEICYCSTLDECWLLSSPAHRPTTTAPITRCPQRSATTFQE